MNQEFHKIKSKLKSINSNRNHVPKAKSNQETKLEKKYGKFYFDYESSEIEDTPSDSGSKVSANTSSISI